MQLSVASNNGSLTPAKRIRRIASLADEPTGRNRPSKEGLTWAEVSETTYPLQMRARLFMVGLGTTGSEVVQTVRTTLGEHRPWSGSLGCFQHLLLDAATAPMHWDQGHFRLLEGEQGTGIDGAGTDPREGRARMLRERNYRDLRHGVNGMLLELAAVTSEWALPSLREACDLVVVAGCGGTSGGAIDPFVTLLHDVCRERNLSNARVTVVLLGPEIAIRDAGRSVTAEQARTIRATAAANLVKMLAQFSHTQPTEEIRADGTSFHVPAGERIWDIAWFDQSNGSFDWPTTEEFVAHTAHCLFLRFFTAAGIHAAHRRADLERLGITGRAQP